MDIEDDNALRELLRSLKRDRGWSIERLHKAMTEAGVSCSKASVGRWVSDEQQIGIYPANQRQIREFLRSEGTLAPPPPAPNPRDEMRLIPAHRIKQYPVVTAAYCANHGVSPVFYGQIDMSTWDGESVAFDSKGREVICFRAAGNCMYPQIIEGDIVVADMHSEIRFAVGKPVACVFVDDQGDEHVVSKILRDLGAVVILESINDDHPNLEIPYDHVKFIWKIIKIIRDI